VQLASARVRAGLRQRSVVLLVYHRPLYIHMLICALLSLCAGVSWAVAQVRGASSAPLALLLFDIHTLDCALLSLCADVGRGVAESVVAVPPGHLLQAGSPAAEQGRCTLHRLVNMMRTSALKRQAAAVMHVCHQVGCVCHAC
jgi:hypothetical protein